MDLKQVIRNIKDFPKPGIVFRDITTLLKNPEAFKFALDQFYSQLKNRNITAIIGIESRGFIFGAPLAQMMNLPLVLVRKPGKLPSETVSQSYELEYGTDSIEIHKDALDQKDNVVIVDDLLATGGTAEASIKLIESLNAKVDSLAFVVELTFLDGRGKLGGKEIISLVKYDSE
ncbi:MAG: adenine phosphoribosyltransferase [candidate division Zixibacteria bacterium]|nr:adenine phosphoribosyltransferase [candidate division Zixibacteria bacterium]